MKGIKVCHLNVCSLVPKLEEIKIILMQTNIDVLALSETWLTPAIPDSFLEITNYDLHRNDRTGKGGGGVAIYISQNYSSTKVASDTTFVTLQITLYLTTEHALTVLVSYRPPNQQSVEYITSLTNSIKSIKTKEYIILGDFNLHWTAIAAKPLKNMALHFGLEQLISEPTRICDTCSSIPDLIFY